jgi:hypothetical protein
MIAVVFEPMTSLIEAFINTATSKVSVRECVRIHHNQYVTQFPKEAVSFSSGVSIMFLQLPPFSHTFCLKRSEQRTWNS